MAGLGLLFALALLIAAGAAFVRPLRMAIWIGLATSYAAYAVSFFVWGALGKPGDASLVFLGVAPAVEETARAVGLFVLLRRGSIGPRAAIAFGVAFATFDYAQHFWELVLSSLQGGWRRDPGELIILVVVKGMIHVALTVIFCAALSRSGGRAIVAVAICWAAHVAYNAWVIAASKGLFALGGFEAEGVLRIAVLTAVSFAALKAARWPVPSVTLV